MPTTFGGGLRIAVDGLKLAFEDDGVHKAYFKVALTLLLMTTAIDVGGLWALWANTAPTAEQGLLVIIGLWALRVVGTVVTLLAAPLVAVLTVNIVMPFFNQGVFLAGLRAADPVRAQGLDGGLSLH
ncbi:MAG: hypothetical protein KC431_15765, partial [Myxococcales bacterium]|nr:hypothetical protein [Myxococcales bacterium]